MSPKAQMVGRFGQSVAINGNAVVVGAFSENSSGVVSAGNAYVFNAQSGALVTTLTSPSPQDYGSFGTVAISGNTVVIGAEGENSSGYPSAGKAYVFTLASTTSTTTASSTTASTSPTTAATTSPTTTTSTTSYSTTSITSSSASVARSSTTTQATSIEYTSSSNEGGAPEFPFQLAVTAVLVTALVVSYLLAKGRRILPHHLPSETT